ncbi:hypothetical protein FDP41_006526 [Naegleria fowleri]|uniref:Uncharacterized protein n=1 Tax=Naegleria fowleri TaxID=5763 RepID=A0A6A5BKB3_NAEFO|nr:uncharacterized protein FDP41_006526 [Naegleria fowleri]KAF0974494.1 hypothetical protein FDP41_006526 [Naegleria fowleri]CAG4716987.1 unnamed protein product [Naegleria fowleri]
MDQMNLEDAANMQVSENTHEENNDQEYHFGEFINSYTFPQSIYTIKLNTMMDILLVNNFLYRIPSMERLLVISGGEDRMTHQYNNLFSPCGEYFVKLMDGEMALFRIDNKLEEIPLMGNYKINGEVYDMEWISLDYKHKEHFIEPLLMKYDPNATPIIASTAESAMAGVNQQQQTMLDPSQIKFETCNNLLALYMKDETNAINNVVLYLNGKLPILKLESTERITKFKFGKDLLSLLDSYNKSLHVVPILENLKACSEDIFKAWNDFFANPTFQKLQLVDIFELMATRLNYINMEIFSSVQDNYYSKLYHTLLHLIEKIDSIFLLMISYIEYLVSNIEDIPLDSYYLMLIEIHQSWKTEICENTKSIISLLADIQAQKSNIFPNIESNFFFFKFDNLIQLVQSLFETMMTSHYFSVTTLDKSQSQKCLKTNHKYCKNSSEYYYYVSDNTLYIFQEGDDDRQPFQIICGLVDDDITELYLYKEKRFIAYSPHTVLYLADNNIIKYAQFEDSISMFAISTQRNLFAVCLSSNDRMFSVYEITD